MKKFIYIILLVGASTLAMTSCTEEAIDPKGQKTDCNGGGGSLGRP